MSEHPGNPVTIIFAVRIVEEGFGPNEGSDLHPAGNLQFGFVDVPEHPGSLEAPARYCSHLLHLHGRQDRSDDVIGQEVGHDLRLRQRLDFRVGGTHRSAINSLRILHSPKEKPSGCAATRRFVIHATE